jgi:hypothetical protein
MAEPEKRAPNDGDGKNYSSLNDRNKKQSRTSHLQNQYAGKPLQIEEDPAVYGELLYGLFGFKSVPPPGFGFAPPIQNILVQEMRNIGVFQNFQQFCLNVIVHCVVDAVWPRRGCS